MQLTWNYLTTPIQRPDIIWPYFSFLGLLIIIAIALYIYADRKKAPKFQKRYLRKIADFLLYLPILLLLILFAIYTEVNSLNLPLFIGIIAFIWLIWFLFLVYYRLVIVRELWNLYWENQEREKYIHGKSKTRT